MGHLISTSKILLQYYAIKYTNSCETNKRKKNIFRQPPCNHFISSGLRHFFLHSFVLFALKPHANGAALLVNNSQHCWMLHVASVCTPCCFIVACCCELLRKVWNQHFFFSVINERCATMLDLFAQLFTTLLGPRTPITYGLQSLMDCILLTMHCRSQHCWELLHPFAHHCKHGLNNSQHYWPNTNNVGSYYDCLFVALVAFKRFSGRYSWSLQIRRTTVSREAKKCI